MEKATKSSSFKPKLQKTKAKAAAIYYGNPAKDLKIIAVTGVTGKDTVANFIHQILLAAKQPAVLISSPTKKPLSAMSLNKQLSQALINNAQYIIVEAPASTLVQHIFQPIPIHIAVLTDLASAQPDHIAAKSLLFQNSPNFTVLNMDDPSYNHFATLPPKTASTTYGRNRASTTRINHAKLYKKGTEASLTVGPSTFDVATFVSGEQAASHMAAAATVAALLNITTDIIVEGIASYEPQSTNS